MNLVNESSNVDQFRIDNSSSVINPAISVVVSKKPIRVKNCGERIGKILF